MSVKDKLTKDLVGMIVDMISSTGKKTYISDEAKVNRKFFTRNHLHRMKLHVFIRALFFCAVWTGRDEFQALGEEIFDKIWAVADEHEYDFYEEDYDEEDEY